jgi:hypothetical protein
VPIGGRIRQWGWSWETRDQAVVDAAGWAGTLTRRREPPLTAAGELHSPAPGLDQLVAGTLVGSPAPVGHIALVAHDNKKAELRSWAEFNRPAVPRGPAQRSSGDGNGALRSICICISMRDS